jgi:hypothetical protein
VPAAPSAPAFAQSEISETATARNTKVKMIAPWRIGGRSSSGTRAERRAPPGVAIPIRTPEGASDGRPAAQRSAMASGRAKPSRRRWTMGWSITRSAPAASGTAPSQASMRRVGSIRAALARSAGRSAGLAPSRRRDTVARRVAATPGWSSGRHGSRRVKKASVAMACASTTAATMSRAICPATLDGISARKRVQGVRVGRVRREVLMRA